MSVVRSLQITFINTCILNRYFKLKTCSESTSQCSESTSISYIVREVCQAIHSILEAQYMPTPSNRAEWSRIAEELERKWQFPNCIGAIDGKHVVICPPSGCGSFYYNYKGTHSVVLMAIAGPNYECLYADVGTNGRVSDGGVWNKTRLLKRLEGGSIGVPEDKPPPPPPLW